MKQSSLFPHHSTSPKEDIRLVISKSKNKILSKEEIAFNKFSQQIESLRKQIENDQKKFDKLSNYFSASVTPAQTSLGNDLILFVKALYAIYKDGKLSKVNQKKVKGVILSNLNNAFQYIIPTDEIKSIYDDLSPTTLDEESAEELNLIKKMMEGMFQSEFGMNVDLSDTEMNEESMARKIAEMKKQYESEQEERNKNHAKRKKSKKEIELEIKNKQAEDLQKKNIRSIYLSLAKMLHPDLETDESLKFDREELMKKVTAAYQEKDLHTLLKLEIEIIHKQSENLDHLTDEKLKFLNSALKEQVIELKDELTLLRSHPRYQNIADYMHQPEDRALRSIDAMINSLVSLQKVIVSDTEELIGDSKVKFITSMLKTVSNKQDMDMDDMDPGELMEFLDFMESMSGAGSGKNSRTKNKKRR
jgi:hypothetical protein